MNLFIKSIVVVSVISSFTLGAMDGEQKKQAEQTIQAAPTIYTLHGLYKEKIHRGMKVDLNVRLDSGATPLVNAAAYGNVEAIELFLKNGADINYTDRYENTALSTALFNKKSDAALYLVKQGAKVYTRTDDGKGKASNKNLIQHVNCETQVHVWPKELLLALQGTCPICLDDIAEVGHIYDCGHSVHDKCKIDQCPYRCSKQ